MSTDWRDVLRGLSDDLNHDRQLASGAVGGDGYARITEEIQDVFDQLSHALKQAGALARR